MPKRHMTKEQQKISVRTLKKVLKHAGGAVALEPLLGISSQAIYQSAIGNSQIGLHTALAICASFPELKLRVKDLRPDAGPIIDKLLESNLSF